MDLNLSIIDQRVRQLVVEHGRALGTGDEARLRSRAFVLLCVHVVLDISLEEALACLTDASQDAAVDALHVGDLISDEFTVTLFQGKYKRRTDGNAGFPAGEIGKIARTVGILFDPDRSFCAHPDLAARVEEIRSLVRDGHIPQVRVVLCNNGRIWGADGDAEIRQAALPESQVSWKHVNHDILVQLQQRQISVKDTLQLSGAAIIENFNFRRVLVGKVPVAELKRLIDQHGDRLLERNIRRFLGTGTSRVNLGIEQTLATPSERPNFYFYNNGITLICSQFRHNELRGGDWQLKVEGLQVINGGQTCNVIRRTLETQDEGAFAQTYVLVRLYEVDEEEHDLIRDITYATNSQNPVDLRDLRSNDPLQKRLELGLGQLDYEYLRKREQGKTGSKVITPAMAAEAVLAIWRRKPHVARFHSGQLFGALYDEVFSDDLAPAQIVVAVRILRAVQRLRRESNLEPRPRFISYAGHFLAMIVGDGLLGRLSIRVADLTHLNLPQALECLESDFPELYERAVLTTQLLFGLVLQLDHKEASLQRLSAVFRRGDLLEALDRLRGEAEQLVIQSRADETALSLSDAAYERLARLDKLLEMPFGPQNAVGAPGKDTREELRDIFEQLKIAFSNELLNVHSRHNLGNNLSIPFDRRIREVGLQLDRIDEESARKNQEPGFGEDMARRLRDLCLELKHSVAYFDGAVTAALYGQRPLLEIAIRLFPDLAG